MRTYLRHRIFNVIDVKELIALEYLDFEGKYKDYEETHDFWEICYVEKGNITLMLEDEPMELRTNELVLVSPNKKHSYRSPKGNMNKVFVICFQSFSQALKAMADMRLCPDAMQIDTIGRITDECSNTFHMNDSDLLEVLPNPNFGGQQVLLIQLEYLLICLLRGLSLDKDSRVVFLSDENFDAVLAEAVIDYFREHICSKLSLDNICLKFNYSRSFLCRTFKKQTGETLISCFNRLKMEEAERLLRGTDRTAISISRHLGFHDVKYFNVLFKKYVGCAPIEYRRQAKSQK